MIMPHNLKPGKPYLNFLRTRLYLNMWRFSGACLVCVTLPCLYASFFPHRATFVRVSDFHISAVLLSTCFASATLTYLCVRNMWTLVPCRFRLYVSV
ncbi:hypothetical protein BGY98DRAFT_720971 [Russula aff. rugulosa BPL654]|nr:hypothetical protein BGY98DRAFT_720971 [Russula aff. rugulosa BPL654]